MFSLAQRHVARALIVVIVSALFVSAAAFRADAIVSQSKPSRLQQSRAAASISSVVPPAAESVVRIARGGLATVATPAGAVTITSPTDGSSGTSAPDGLTKLYAGKAASTGIAVQPLAEGVRNIIFVDSASSPERYGFTFGGVVAALKVQPDGSVFTLDASGRPLGTVEAPWAVDRSGRSVPTHYEVDGTTLIQVVEHKERNYAYGIVADPWWNPFSWNWSKIGHVLGSSLRRCGIGALTGGTGTLAGNVAVNLVRNAAGKYLVSLYGGPYGLVSVAVASCVNRLLG